MQNAVSIQHSRSILEHRLQGLGTCCRGFVLDSDLHRSKQHSTTKHRGPQWCTEVRDLSCARSSGSFDILAALANRVAGSAQGARRQWHHVAGSRPSTCSASRQVAQVHVGTVRQQKHACSSTVALFAHCASCVPRGRRVHPTAMFPTSKATTRDQG